MAGDGSVARSLNLPDASPVPRFRQIRPIHGAQLGQGCFHVHEPPYDPAVVAPHLLRYLDTALELQSFAWQDLANIPSSEAQRQELLALQDQAVVDSVAYVKGLNI